MHDDNRIPDEQLKRQIHSRWPGRPQTWSTESGTVGWPREGGAEAARQADETQTNHISSPPFGHGAQIVHNRAVANGRERHRLAYYALPRRAPERPLRVKPSPAPATEAHQFLAADR